MHAPLQCDFAAPPIRRWNIFIFTSLNLTLFNSKHDTSRGLKSACALGFVHFLLLETTMQSWAGLLENERPHGKRSSGKAQHWLPAMWIRQRDDCRYMSDSRWDLENHQLNRVQIADPFLPWQQQSDLPLSKELRQRKPDQRAHADRNKGQVDSNRCGPGSYRASQHLSA